jgi:hypothetical protein
MGAEGKKIRKIAVKLCLNMWIELARKGLALENKVLNPKNRNFLPG